MAADVIERARTERAAAAWKFGGFEAYYGPFPGLARASVIMIRGGNRAARRYLARLFVSLPARWGAAHILRALHVLRVLVDELQQQRIATPAPAPAPVRLISQRGWRRPVIVRGP